MAGVTAPGFQMEKKEQRAIKSSVAAVKVSVIWVSVTMIFLSGFFKDPYVFNSN